MVTSLVNNRKNDEFQFVLKAGNGQVNLPGEVYLTKSAVENGFKLLREN